MRIKFDEPELKPLIPEQEKAAHATGNVLIEGGPGTGKTTVMTEAVHYTYNNLTKNILCLTFGKGTKWSWRKRLLQRFGGDLNFEVRTFHSFAHSFLKQPKIALEGAINNTLAIICGDRSYVPKLKNIIDKHKSCGEELMPWDKAYFVEYEAWLHKKRMMDYNDLILKCFEKLDVTYDRVFVDEYQDTSGLQYKLLHKVANEVFVMDEPFQRIYHWRDADERNIIRVKADYNPMVYPLVCDHRHAKSIVSYIEHIYERGLKPLRGVAGLVIKKHFNSGEEEAQAVAELSEEAEGVYILAREHAQFLPVMRLLKDRISLVKDFGCDTNDYNPKYLHGKLQAMTLHSVKGKEAYRVILIGVDEGRVPHGLSDNLTEEKNLFYTGCARATDELYIFSHADTSRWV